MLQRKEAAESALQSLIGRPHSAPAPRLAAAMPSSVRSQGLVVQAVAAEPVIDLQQSVDLIQSTSFALAALHTLWLKCDRSWRPHPKSWSRSLPPTPHRRSEAVGTALLDDRRRYCSSNRAARRSYSFAMRSMEFARGGRMVVLSNRAHLARAVASCVRRCTERRCQHGTAALDPKGAGTNKCAIVDRVNGPDRPPSLIAVRSGRFLTPALWQPLS